MLTLDLIWGLIWSELKRGLNCISFFRLS
jgi:hypothetical protein